MATYKCRRCGITRNDFQKDSIAHTSERCSSGSSTVSSHAWQKISDKDIY